MKRISVLAVCIAVVSVRAVVADTSEPPARKASPPYKWYQVRNLDRFVGSDRAKEMLLKQGFVVTDQQYLQIFQAYVSMDAGQSLPKFITVDSAWHTYHVLLEDGVRQVELAQGELLRRFSRRLYELAADEERRNDKVYRDLAAFAAVGLALLEPDSVKELPADRRAVVESVLAAINSGGPPKEGILFFELPLMPGQFRPVSFYAKTPELSRYFAARQWYATRVFRLQSDAETTRALHLALLVESDAELKRLYGRLTTPYDAMVGPTDDPGVVQYLQVARKTAGGLPKAEKIPAIVAAFRREAAKLPAAQINDQWLAPDDYENRAERTRGMRVLGPRTLPCSALFQKTVAPAVGGRMFPSGLDIFAAGPLACDAGRRALKKTVRNAATAEAIFAADSGPLPDSLHGRAMQLLTLLQKPLPTATAERIPPALRTPAWQDKQLATGLAAWAEERHTWALHGKNTLHVGCMSDEPPGYVSPYPEFYRGLGKLARRAATALRQANPDGPDLAAAGREWLEMMRKKPKESADPRMISMAEIEEGNRREHVYHMYLKEHGKNPFSFNPSDRKDALTAVWKAAERCVEGKNVTEADRRYMEAFIDGPEGKALDLLPEFADLCDRLAEIAQKELDGEKLNVKDANFIRRYGEVLAKFHFYGGNSYIGPRDDFPMVSPVFVSPHGNRAQTLYAGVARPEAIYVVVQSGKRAVLHRGAVLSYREFRRGVDQPLDDDAWTTEIRAGKAPPPPSWTASFRQTITEKEAAILIRAGEIYPGISMMHGREITQAMIDAFPDADSDAAYWLREQIAYRATNDDIPALIDLLAASKEQAASLADCMAEMRQIDWSRHREKLAALLTHETLQVADSAANLMRFHPESIDVEVLVDDYEQQSRRTRRLYLYVIGHSKKLGRRGEQLLIKALKDPHAGVRCPAASAVNDIEKAGPDIVAALIAGIDDKNEYTATVMVRALATLGAKEAGSKMLARLKGPFLSRNGFDDDSIDKARQLGEIDGDSKYPGSGRSRALQYRDPGGMLGQRSGSLTEELVRALGQLKYKPARNELYAIVRSKSPRWKQSYLGHEALVSLCEIEPKNKRKLLLEILGDVEANWMAARKAVILAGETQDPSYIEALLPLADIPGHPGYRDDIARPTYQAIVKLSHHIDTGTPSGDKLIGRIRGRFLKNIRGPNAAAAMEALFELDAEAAYDEAIKAALDKTASRDSRSGAAWVFRQSKDPNHVRKLLPLLQDESPSRFEGDQIRDDMATVISSICGNLDPKKPDHSKALALAGDALRKMLHGPRGAAAVEPLARLEGDADRYVEVLLRTAGDRSLANKTRIRALELIVRSGDELSAEKLGPLLNDQTQADAGGLSIAEHAANSIAALTGRWERIDAKDPAETRKEGLRKARTWIADE